MTIRSPLTKGQSGQALVMLVMGLVVFVGFVALTIDVGLIFEGRRGQQNAADAAALRPFPGTQRAPGSLPSIGHRETAIRAPR